jgi:glycosyltransferase involved in cell wall biosynthesis
MPFKTAPDGDKEGIPNSVKEASATGLPVVSTFHSGVPEAVLDGKTGLLADEEEEDALVGKLSYLIENQDVWSIFGKAGRELMEKEFDIIKETEKLEGFYSKLLA